MTKFLFYTDCHITGQTPRNRIDDYPNALIRKVHEVYSIAGEEGCEFVTFGGDCFNSHRIFSYEVLAGFMDAVCDSSLKTYMVAGEHDLYAHNPKTFVSSTLAFVQGRCGNIEILWEPKDVDGGITLYGKHEWEKMEAAMAVKPVKGRTPVLLCHELLCPVKMPYDIIDTASLTGCPYSLVLSGDLHNGFDVHMVDGTVFANPGSLARQNISDSGRIPQVAIVTIDGKDIDVRYRVLKSAEPGDNVFGESLLNLVRNEQESEKAASSFVDGLLELEVDAADVHELIERAGKKAGLGAEVLAYLASKRRLSDG